MIVTAKLTQSQKLKEVQNCTLKIAVDFLDIFVRKSIVLNLVKDTE